MFILDDGGNVKVDLGNTQIKLPSSHGLWLQNMTRMCESEGKPWMDPKASLLHKNLAFPSTTKRLKQFLNMSLIPPLIEIWILEHPATNMATTNPERLDPSTLSWKLIIMVMPSGECDTWLARNTLDPIKANSFRPTKKFRTSMIVFSNYKKPTNNKNKDQVWRLGYKWIPKGWIVAPD